MERIGVRPYDAKAIIEIKLKNYDEHDDSITREINCRDMIDFLDFWKKNKNEASIFNQHSFLFGRNKGELILCTANDICIDDPYKHTGLAGLSDIHQKNTLWEGYKNLFEGEDLTLFIEFLENLGVFHKLVIRKVPVPDEIKGKWWEFGCPTETNTKLDEDYNIDDIKKYIDAKDFAASKLLWETLITAEKETANAQYYPNQNKREYKIVEDSQLVKCLKEHAWIPDGNGVFHCPGDMTKDDLRGDFIYDDRNGLLSKIEFGSTSGRLTEKDNEKIVKYLGLKSVNELEQIKKMDRLLKKNKKSLEEFLKDLEEPEFPSRQAPDPEHRKEKVRERSSDSPAKTYDAKTRNVRTSSGHIDRDTYLRNMYKNSSGQLVCQICKKIMPFKKKNEEFYFESTQLFDNDHFSKENESVHIALCPVCHAKYNEFVFHEKTEMEKLLENLKNSKDMEIEIRLGNQSETIRFVETHFIDLQETIKEYTESKGEQNG